MKKEIYFEKFNQLNINIDTKIVKYLSDDILLTLFNCIDKFYKTFPITEIGIQDIRFFTKEELKHEVYTDAFCRWDDTATHVEICLNPIHFILTKKKMCKAQSKKLNIEFSKGIESVIYHELGHLLEMDICHCLYVNNEPYEIAKKVRENNETYIIVQCILEKLFPYNKNYIYDNISWYGTVNPSECFAELIAIIMVEKDLRISAQKLKDYLIESGYMI